MENTTKFLLNQQRIAFKQNWKDELANWEREWDDETYKELSELDSVTQLLNYLVKQASIDEYGCCEYLYHNIANQAQKQAEEMFNDIKKALDDTLEEQRLYANGEL